MLVAVAGDPAGVLAQSTPRILTDAEKQQAHQLEEAKMQQLRNDPASPLFSKGIAALARTPAGQTRKSIVTDTTLLGSPGTSGPGERQARVTRYDYATGLTISTVVDLNSGRVVDVRADPNRPTALAPDEVQRAIVLASRAVTELATAPRSGVEVLALVDGRKTSRRYGHRLAVVWRNTPPSPRVLVDLSTEQVVNANF
jgi:hypothetical protein